MFEREYLDVLKEHQKVYNELKSQRQILKQVDNKLEKSKQDIKALKVVGQNMGEILKKIDDDKYIVKTSHGPRYVVGCANNVDRSKLVMGTRVALDVVTLTITLVLSKEVDPTIYKMQYMVTKPKEKKTGEKESERAEKKGWKGKKASNYPKTNINPGDLGEVDFEKIGGLEKEIKEIREVIELPLKNPGIFKRVGIKPPKGVLLYGPPGCGKTLIVKAIANTMNVNFLKAVASSLIEKYIGESSRLIRELFAYAKRMAPAIIFLDEIDAIGSKRSDETNSSDREVQRTLMELLNQLDGFSELENVKVIMATNRPDILDSALLRPGRLDRKIEIGLPNEKARRSIFRIYSEYEISDEVIKLTEGFNGADIRNVCTEAGMHAIRSGRDEIKESDLLESCRKMIDAKKLENRLDYKKH